MTTERMLPAAETQQTEEDPLAAARGIVIALRLTVFAVLAAAAVFYALHVIGA